MNKIHFIKLIIIVSALVIFSLTSCGILPRIISRIKANTADPGGIIIEQSFEVRFFLTGANTNNFSAVTVSNATYTYAPNDSFTLTATKTSLSSSAYSSNFFHYTVTPANVLNITGTTTNSITFALTNMEPGSVKITATATNNIGQTNRRFTYTINLQKASYPIATPPIVYVATDQTNIVGFVLTYAVQTGSDKRSTYQNTTMLSNISGSATAGIGSDGTVTVTNGISGTSVFEVRLTSPNYVDYVVRIISEAVTVPQTYDVLFSLTGGNTNHFSAVTATSATYTYAPNDSFTLTATKTNLSSYAYSSNFFHYRVTPANVLNITGTTTNSITFALTNMEPGVVLITAIATNNLGQTNGEHTYTINLQKASYPVATPPIVYVTTNQTNIAGFVLTYGVQTGSDKRSTYQNTTVLSNISGSATAGIGSDGMVTVTNGISGTSVFEVRLTSPNYVDYVVRIISVAVTVPQTYDVLFSLTGANTDNFSAVTATSATYTYAPNDSFTLTATKTNLSSYAYSSNFFHYTVTSTNVLNITGTTTNSITFALTNMEPGVVLITAIATNNLGQTNGEHTYTINLQKASYPVATPPIVYVATNQVGINGAVLTYGVQTGSDKRSTYQNTTVLSNISGSATAGISADGTVTVTNGTAIGISIFEVRLMSPNYVDYIVRIISEVTSAPGYDVLFALTRTNNFSAITGTGAVYTYAPGDSVTLTAIKTNFRISAKTDNFFHYTVTPANVLNITATTTNSITFALTNMEPGSVRITAIATNNLGQTNGQFTYTISLRKASYPVATPPLVYVTTNQTNIAGFVLTYAVQTGGDKRSTYQNTTELSNISGSATAGISADGTVTVTNGTATGTSVFEVRLMSPNYVDYIVRIISEVDTTARLKEIIAGGVIPANLGSDPLVKDILGHLGANAGASIKVLYVSESGSGNNSGTDWNNAINGNNLRNTIVNISDASATKPYLVLVGEGTYKPTTGTESYLSFTMKNFTAIIGGFSATGNRDLTGTTTFSGDIGRVNDNTDNTFQVFSHNNIPLNNAVLYGVNITRGNGNVTSLLRNKGGGMYNNNASPRLLNIRFVDNSATQHGGGMYNVASSPVLTGVVFTGNSARNNGGGMYNSSSSPVLTRVVFTGNSATQHGGGMYNTSSSPVLAGVVFTGNSAANGGGMYNENASGPLIMNTIFAWNTATVKGPDIINADGETIRIAGSVLGIGLANPKSGIVGIGSGHLNLTYRSLTNGAVDFGPNATAGILSYPTIQSSSSAVDIGLYVRRSGTDYYFSENNNNWYTNFTATGGFGTPVGNPPADAVDLTATDIAGNPRVGRPDAGVYEVR